MNRLPYSTPVSVPSGLRSKMQHTQSLTGSELLDAVVDGDRPVVVLFWTSGRQNDRRTLQSIDALAGRLQQHAIVGRLDVSEHESLAARIGIRDLPALVVFREEEPVHALAGAGKIQAFVDRIQREVFGQSAAATEPTAEGRRGKKRTA